MSWQRGCGKLTPWSKSLEKLPAFTRKEIYLHRNESGKRKADDVSKPITFNIEKSITFLQIQFKWKYLKIILLLKRKAEQAQAFEKFMI